jgi:hypothetical protein
VIPVFVVPFGNVPLRKCPKMVSRENLLSIQSFSYQPGIWRMMSRNGQHQLPEMGWVALEKALGPAGSAADFDVRGIYQLGDLSAFNGFAYPPTVLVVDITPELIDTTDIKVCGKLLEYQPGIWRMMSRNGQHQLICFQWVRLSTYRVGRWYNPSSPKH